MQASAFELLPALAALLAPAMGWASEKANYNVYVYVYMYVCIYIYIYTRDIMI